jgi:hypothetical protein
MAESKQPTRLRTLNATDGEAVDAILASRCEPGADAPNNASETDVTGHQQSDQNSSSSVTKLLDLIQHWPTDSSNDNLVERTLQAVTSQGDVSQGEASQDDTGSLSRRTTLCQADAQALDSLLEARSDVSAPLGQTESSLSPRQQRVSQVLSLLDCMPGEMPSTDLVSQTLKRIANESTSEFKSFSNSTSDDRHHENATKSDSVAGYITDATDQPSGPAIAFRWSELIAVCAVMLIGLSLIWPALNRTRNDSMRIACANNLAAAGRGMVQYGMDEGHYLLPRHRTRAGDTWWNVGSRYTPSFTETSSKNANANQTRSNIATTTYVQSNSANLYLLRSNGYVSAQTLACPSNVNAPLNLATSAFDWDNPLAISYSYQNQFTPKPYSIRRTNSLVVLADKSPLFIPQAASATNKSASHRFAKELDINAPGHRHQKPGQSALIIDGRVIWTNAPVLMNGDNFYTANGINTYTGNEVPHLNDSFLVP